MFTTSLTAAAVAGFMASSALVGQPDWAPSYGKALSLAAEHRKPVAVFLTQDGLSRLTNGKGLGSDATKSLRSDYIAVQIDTSTDSGKKMAEAFGIKEGVILSDRTGGRIALRHEGAVVPTDLSGYLTKYSTATDVVTTDYRSSVVNQPVAPVYAPAPVYQQPRPVLNAIQNFNTAVFGGPILGGS